MEFSPNNNLPTTEALSEQSIVLYSPVESPNIHSLISYNSALEFSPNQNLSTLEAMLDEPSMVLNSPIQSPNIPTLEPILEDQSKIPHSLPMGCTLNQNLPAFQEMSEALSMLHRFMELNDSSKNRFVDFLRKQLEITDLDSYNIKCLISQPTNEDYMDFLIRFGPLSTLVQSVREFVLSGAKKWYLGQFKSESDCVETFKKFGDTGTYYFLQSLPLVKNIKESLAENIISRPYYLLSKKEDKNITKMFIYKNIQPPKFCAIFQGEQLFFDSISDIIRSVIPMGIPISHTNYCNLVWIS